MNPDEQKYQGMTHEQVLSEIANKNTVSKFEENYIKYVAWEFFQLNNAVVTCGLIYPTGHGMATSCNQFAKQVLRAIKESASTGRL